jgi:hypothetical protein
MDNPEKHRVHKTKKNKTKTQHKMCWTPITQKYRINWEIYTPYAGATGMLLYINGKFTMGKLKSSLLS